ncbi:MAG: response regulator [Gammaproteobacteria bacterium]
MVPDSQTENKPGILVVDDSRLIRVAAKKILSSDFSVTEAKDGEDAWSILQAETSLQIVMSDLSMPNLDGLGLLSRLRKSEDPRLRDIPVIIATGAEDDDGSKEKALSAGANNFIIKPFDKAQLLASAKLLQQQRQTALALQASESANIELESQVSIDIVTGLFNQKALEQRGEEQLAFAVRHNTELALLSIQLDKYKIHFLRHGKAFALELLREFSKLLTQGRRREDSLAHLGHGEFALLLPSSDPIGTKYLADALKKRIEQHQFNIMGKLLTVTASIGIAGTVFNHSTQFTKLLEDTRQQLKVAELDGGNRIQPGVKTSQPEPAQSNPVKVPAPATAQADEIIQAMTSLRFNTPMSGDINAIARAVFPLLESWNTQHGNQYAQQLETIRRTLFNNTPVTSGSETEPA